MAGAVDLFLSDKLKLLLSFGNEQLENKGDGTKSKHYKALRGVSVDELCDEVEEVARTADPDIAVVSMRLSKMPALMHGLARLNETRLDESLKNLKTSLAKVSALTKDDLGGIDMTVKRGSRGRKTTKQDFSNISLGDLGGDGLEMDNESLDSMGDCGRFSSPSSSRIVEPSDAEYEEAIGLRPRPPLPSEDNILRLLQKHRESLKPLATLINDVDLPPPAMLDEDMGFEDFPPDQLTERTEEGQRALETLDVPSKFVTEEDNVLDSPPRGVRAVEIPQAPGRSKSTSDPDKTETSFELQSLDSSLTKPAPSGSRARRSLAFDANITITDAEMKSRYETAPISPQTISDIQKWNKPAVIQLATVISSSGTKISSKLMREGLRGLERGLDSIQLSGRPILGRELKEMVAMIEPILTAVVPVIPVSKAKKERVAVPPEPEPPQSPQQAHAEPPSGQQLMEEEPMAGAEPDALLEFLQQRSQSPELNQVRLTFRELVPVTASRRKAAHMFASLMKLQAAKKVVLEQNEPFGPIYIQKVDGVEDLV